MPTYQYACTACHHQLEAVQSFTDDALTQCPVCDGQLRKLFGSVGIVFKGPGFYRTDSRNGSNGNGSHKGDGKVDDNGASKPSANGKEKTGSSDGSGGSGGGGKEKAPATASSTAST